MGQVGHSGAVLLNHENHKSLAAFLLLKIKKVVVVVVVKGERRLLGGFFLCFFLPGGTGPVAPSEGIRICQEEP